MGWGNKKKKKDDDDSVQDQYTQNEASAPPPKHSAASPRHEPTHAHDQADDAARVVLAARERYDATLGQTVNDKLDKMATSAAKIDKALGSTAASGTVKKALDAKAQAEAQLDHLQQVVAMNDNVAALSATLKGQGTTKEKMAEVKENLRGMMDNAVQLSGTGKPGEAPADLAMRKAMELKDAHLQRAQDRVSRYLSFLDDPIGDEKGSGATAVANIPDIQMPPVRVHSISMDESVNLALQVLELAQSTAEHSDRVEPAPFVDALLHYVANYGLYVHFPVYQRLGKLPAGYTREKGAALFKQSVPGVFATIARHVMRPRILDDRSLTIPLVTLPLCNGARYGGLPAVTEKTPVSDSKTPAGYADPSLAGVYVGGVPLQFRPRVYEAVKAAFAHMKQVELAAEGEALVPARWMYWREGLNCFTHFLQLATNDLDAQVFTLDTILRPICFPDFPAPPPYPGGERPPKGHKLRAAWDSDAMDYHLGEYPPELQWMASDVLQGVDTRLSRTEFMQRELKGMLTHPSVTPASARKPFLADMKSDIAGYMMPPRGVVPAVTSLRSVVLLVDGLGRPANATAAMGGALMVQGGGGGAQPPNGFRRDGQNINGNFALNMNVAIPVAAARALRDSCGGFGCLGGRPKPPGAAKAPKRVELIDENREATGNAPAAAGRPPSPKPSAPPLST